MYSSNINKVWYAGGKIDLWRGLIYHIGIRDFDGPKYSFLSETQYATGCCICLKNDDLKKLNYFDETFDMYCEDVDLSLKAHQLNRKIIYAPKSVILTTSPSYSFPTSGSVTRTNMNSLALVALSFKPDM